MKINPYKYPFIAIEGIDGCGKSTLIEGLQKWDKENGIGSIFTKEPTDGDWGQMIRFILNNNGYDIHEEKVSAENLQRLYIWDRLRHRQVEAVFLEKYPIFSDRDFPSTMAYGIAEGLDSQLILSFHKFILEDYFFVPDLILILDLEAEKAMERSRKSGKTEDYFERKLQLQKKIREAYLQFPKIMKKFYPDVSMRVEIIDASPPPEKILENVIPIIKEVFRKKKN